MNEFTAHLNIANIVNGLTIFAKKLHRRYSKYASEGVTNVFLSIMKYAILLIIIECSIFKVSFQYLSDFLVPIATFNFSRAKPSFVQTKKTLI